VAVLQLVVQVEVLVEAAEVPLEVLVERPRLLAVP